MLLEADGEQAAVDWMTKKIYRITTTTTATSSLLLVVASFLLLLLLHPFLFQRAYRQRKTSTFPTPVSVAITLSFFFSIISLSLCGTHRTGTKERRMLPSHGLPLSLSLLSCCHCCCQCMLCDPGGGRSSAIVAGDVAAADDHEG